MAYKARTAKSWAAKIKKEMRRSGTYDASYDTAIDLTATLLAQRDEALKQYYEEYDGRPIVEYTNSAGATNLVKNPALTLSASLSEQAARLLNQLGLTARGMKSIKPGTGSDGRESIADLLDESEGGIG